MIQSPTCLRYLESYGLRKGPEFHITAAGTDERMLPCIVNRPRGTESWLFMQFHTPVIIGTPDGEKKYFPENTFMIWDERDGHYYGNPEREWIHSWIHCVGADLKKIVSKAKIPLRTPFLFKDSERFKNIVAQIYYEISKWESPDETILFKLLELLVLELSRAVKGGKSKNDIPARMLKVKTCIEKNFNKRVSLKRLAGEASISIPHLCAEFKKYFSHPPLDYLISLRMEHARRLLSDINYNVKETAAAVGYDDPFQFSKLFKKRFGVSPRLFRAGVIN